MAERQKEESLWKVECGGCGIVAEALLAWLGFLFIIWLSLFIVLFSLSWGVAVLGTVLAWILPLGVILSIPKLFALAQAAWWRLEKLPLKRCDPKEKEDLAARMYASIAARVYAALATKELKKASQRRAELREILYTGPRASDVKSVLERVFPNVKVEVRDPSKLSELPRPPNEPFHAVVSLNTLHVVDNPVAMLDEIERVLAPKGVLVLVDNRRTWLGLVMSPLRRAYTTAEAKEWLGRSKLRPWKLHSRLLSFTVTVDKLPLQEIAAEVSNIRLSEARRSKFFKWWGVLSQLRVAFAIERPREVYKGEFLKWWRVVNRLRINSASKRLQEQHAVDLDSQVTFTVSHTLSKEEAMKIQRSTTAKATDFRLPDNATGESVVGEVPAVASGGTEVMVTAKYGEFDPVNFRFQVAAPSSRSTSTLQTRSQRRSNTKGLS